MMVMLDKEHNDAKAIKVDPCAYQQIPQGSAMIQ
jgi:hypothetical protein